MTYVNTKKPVIIKVILLMGVMFTTLLGAGCSQFIDPNVPEPIRQRKNPISEKKYLLYRPSSYDKNLYWPLLVVAHGGFPDSAVNQIKNWTQLAEEKGIIVIAPKLTYPSAGWLTSAEKNKQNLLADEKHILESVEHIIAGHNISEGRIMIAGFDDGAMVALYTGLKNPGIFRAASLDHPTHDPVVLSSLQGRVDPYQPVFLHDDVGDKVSGSEAEKISNWMLKRSLEFTFDQTGIAIGVDADKAVSFFENAINYTPWLRVRAFPYDLDPMEFQFKLTSNFEPASYQWEFGDGDESPVASPVHLYEQPGLYPVKLTVTNKKGKVFTRRVDLSLPEGYLLIPQRY